MKTKLIEHAFAVVFVTGLLVAVMLALSAHSRALRYKKEAAVREFSDLTFVDFSDPFQRALLKDVMNIFRPGQYDKNSALVDSVLAFKKNELARKLQQSYLKEELSAKKIMQLLGMYARFLLVYLVVTGLVYYGVQTIGLWRFVRKKREALFTPDGARPHAVAIIKKILATLSYVVLFSPAYVIAYSIRTEFNTDTVFFMALLAVISNGLLITYSNKFYSFLIAESRKGYVETAVAKGLFNAYSPHAADGISLRAMLRPVKRFNGHVLDHIFRNARFQYLPTVKEQASFLITGLIIIEMALNIHGHLSYEMMRQLLYKNYDIVLAIVLLIFFTVKVTEIAVDALVHREKNNYENRPL